jgi:hypothetical protein
MADQQFTAIDLSQDELSFVLTLLNLNEISGFAVPSDFDEAATSAAGDSLTARGLAVEADGGQTIHHDIAALVSIGALYNVALGISVQRGGAAPNRYWFYVSPERVVFHSKPRLGVERFELLQNSDDFVKQLAALLETAGNASKPGYGVFMVPKVVLAQAETVRANKGDTASQAMLREQNLPETFAANVLDETKQIICVTIRVTANEQGEVHAETNTNMLIATGNGYWLLSEDESDIEQLIAQPVDGVMALDFMAQLTAL